MQNLYYKNYFTTLNSSIKIDFTLFLPNMPKITKIVKMVEHPMEFQSQWSVVKSVTTLKSSKARVPVPLDFFVLFQSLELVTPSSLVTTKNKTEKNNSQD